MPPLITAQALEKSFGSRRLLSGVSFVLEERDRVGIVGVNGSGKTTLLRLLVAGGSNPDPTTQPDEGSIARRRGLELQYVPQEPQLDPSGTVLDTLRLGLAAHQRALERLTELGAELGELDGVALTTALDEQAALHDRLTGQLGGWDREHELGQVAQALDLPPMSRVVGELSLGEQRRVALARALVARPELLVLDEPTNHLDMQAVDWLQNWLTSQSSALLLVTHDRYFLDRVALRIFELDRGQLYAYSGGYSRFLELQAERLEQESQRERDRAAFVRRELDWIRRGPAARTTKQQARIDRFDEAVAAAPGAQDRRPGDMVLELPAGPRLGKTVLELHGVGIERGGRCLVRKLDLLLKPGDRVGIIGPNGSGKTTLLQVMMGRLPPTSGQVTIGLNTRFAYSEQDRSELRGDQTVLEAVAGEADHLELESGRMHVRGFLRRMLFDDGFADVPVSALSGGERNRVQLAKLLRARGNVVVLDEPTNDLDLMTLGVLETALSAAPGCALIVSHDRWFLDHVATMILAFEGDGKVTAHAGNYSDYAARELAARQAASAEAEGAAASLREGKRPGKAVRSDSAAPPSRAEEKRGPRRLTFRERQELGGIEARLEEAEAQVAELVARLGDPTFYRRQSDEVSGAVAALDAARSEVERLYARWQELETIETQER